MLQPKRSKYKKTFRGKRRGIASRGLEVSFGEFGLKACQGAWISSNQIEAARRAITHEFKGGGRVWVRIFPDKPVTARASGQRMGGGKGDIAKYVSVITPGKILFEVAGITSKVAQRAFELAAAKLPIKTRVVIRG